MDERTSSSVVVFPPVISAGTHIARFCAESVRRASSGHAPASKKKRVATHVRWVLHAGHDPTGLSTIDVELGRRRFARAASARSMARCGPSVNDGTQTRRAPKGRFWAERGQECSVLTVARPICPPERRPRRHRPSVLPTPSPPTLSTDRAPDSDCTRTIVARVLYIPHHIL